MYFANFPVILYDAVGNFDFKVVTNLLRRVALRANLRDDLLVFDTYTVKDGESPEILAHKLYGDSELHWIILLVNNITDRYHQWPKPYTQQQEFLLDKYPTVLEQQALHHFEIEQTSGDTTIKIDIGKDNTAFPSASTISNIDFEEDLQQKQRLIRLLDPSYLPQFIEEFEKLMEESAI